MDPIISDPRLFPRLKADMEYCARELVLLMKNPRVVRVLSHTFPGMELHFLDVLTERRRATEHTAPWDADGEESEESVSITDLFASDSSSDESSW